jgi:hypothetical protein
MHILGAIAEFERERIRERVHAGFADQPIEAGARAQFLNEGSTASNSAHGRLIGVMLQATQLDLDRPVSLLVVRRTGAES